MALTFIPEIWSSRILSALEKALVFCGPGVVNRDYEGEIRSQGDTVRIRSISDPTIATYTRNSTSITFENLTDAQRALVIDQAKYFAFEVDDIDRAQEASDSLSEALMRASYKLRDTADQFMAAKYTDAQVANQLGTVAVTTGALAYSTLVDLNVVLDEANVPDEGRYVIVPSWYHGLLLLDDRFVRADAAGPTLGPLALRKAFVGEAAGFAILKSNNCVLVTGDDYAVQAGHPMAQSYAEQIVSTEKLRPESAFSDAVKGLHVYGAKTVRPEALATVIASQT